MPCPLTHTGAVLAGATVLKQICVPFIKLPRPHASDRWAINTAIFSLAIIVAAWSHVFLDALPHVDVISVKWGREIAGAISLVLSIVLAVWVQRKHRFSIALVLGLWIGAVLMDFDHSRSFVRFLDQNQEQFFYRLLLDLMYWHKSWHYDPAYVPHLTRWVWHLGIIVASIVTLWALPLRRRVIQYDHDIAVVYADTRISVEV
jgi:hypothetical protein